MLRTCTSLKVTSTSTFYYLSKIHMDITPTEQKVEAILVLSNFLET